MHHWDNAVPCVSEVRGFPEESIIQEPVQRVLCLGCDAGCGCFW
jgi:hypothetical protein